MKALGLPRQGSTVRLEREASKVSILRSSSRSIIGHIVVAENDGSTLTIERLCIQEEHRGFGAGSEAFHLLLRAAAVGGWQRLLAHAPSGNGLAVYFWMRMGFRPLFGGTPDGGMALERSVPEGDVRR